MINLRSAITHLSDVIHSISTVTSRPRPHSITSSAATCSVGGTVRPSALAVLRFIPKPFVCTADPKKNPRRCQPREAGVRVNPLGTARHRVCRKNLDGASPLGAERHGASRGTWRDGAIRRSPHQDRCPPGSDARTQGHGSASHARRHVL